MNLYMTVGIGILFDISIDIYKRISNSPFYNQNDK